MRSKLLGMREKALRYLTASVARLASNACVILGPVEVERYFGTGPDSYCNARAFAELNHCAFIREGAIISLGKTGLCS